MTFSSTEISCTHHFPPINSPSSLSSSLSSLPVNVSLLLTLAKGWGVTRSQLQFSEWRGILAIDTAFYIVTVVSVEVF